MRVVGRGGLGATWVHTVPLQQYVAAPSSSTCARAASNTARVFAIQDGGEKAAICVQPTPSYSQVSFRLTAASWPPNSTSRSRALSNAIAAFVRRGGGRLADTCVQPRPSKNHRSARVDKALPPNSQTRPRSGSHAVLKSVRATGAANGGAPVAMLRHAIPFHSLVPWSSPPSCTKRCRRASNPPPHVTSGLPLSVDHCWAGTTVAAAIAATSIDADVAAARTTAAPRKAGPHRE